MCFSCWIEAGQPAIDNSAVRLAARAADQVYEHNGAGGRLHTLLDDWNADDETIGWLRGYLESDDADTPEQDKAERFCLKVFGSMTEEERISALALQEGMWGGAAGDAV